MSERNFKDLITDSINIFKSNIISILLLALMVFLPVSIANVYLADSIIDIDMIDQLKKVQESEIDFNDYENQAIMAAITKQFFTYVAITFLISLFALAGDIAIIKLVQDTTGGIKRSFMEVFEESIRQFPGVLWVYLLSNIMIAFGFMLIFPGILMYFLYAFTVQAAVLFRLKGMRAIQYGSFVTRKSYLKVVGYVIFNVAVSISFSFMTSMPLDYIKNATFRNVASVLIQTGNSFILCIPTILLTLLFLDMQKNVEERVNEVFGISYAEGQS